MDNYQNPAPLDDAITTLELQIEIGRSFYPEHPDHVAGLERAVRILKRTRVDDEIRASWGASPPPMRITF